jgi:hypothetical protein
MICHPCRNGRHDRCEKCPCQHRVGHYVDWSKVNREEDADD